MVWMGCMAQNTNKLTAIKALYTRNTPTSRILSTPSVVSLSSSPIPCDLAWPVWVLLCKSILLVWAEVLIMVYLLCYYFVYAYLCLLPHLHSYWSNGLLHWGGQMSLKLLFPLLGLFIRVHTYLLGQKEKQQSATPTPPCLCVCSYTLAHTQDNECICVCVTAMYIIAPQP